MKTKRNLCLILFALIFSVVLLSCKKSEKSTPKEQNEETSYASLSQNIQAYDAYFQSTLPVEVRINWGNIWKKIKGGLKVVGADIAGGLSGANLGKKIDGTSGEHSYEVGFGIVGAVAASAAKAIDEFGPSPSSSNRSTIQTQFFSFEETGSLVGEAHNQIMIELFSIYERKGVTKVSSEQLHLDILTLTKLYLSNNFHKYNTSILHQITHNTENIKNALTNLSDEETIVYLRNCKYGKEDDLNLIADYLLKVQSLQDLEHRREYAKGYVDIVKNSKIPEDSKRIIIDATSTAINSLTLWEENKN